MSCKRPLPAVAFSIAAKARRSRARTKTTMERTTTPAPTAVAGIYRNLSNGAPKGEQFPQLKKWGIPASGSPSRRGRPVKVQDNRTVHAFASNFWNATDMTQVYPGTDDILSGVLALKTDGDSATRSLSRTCLFHILSNLDSISVREVQALLRSNYSERTVQKYTEAARVASKGLASFAGTLTAEQADKKHSSRLAEMRAIGAPYAADAAKAEALSLSLPRKRGEDTLDRLTANECTPEAILRRCGYA